MKFPIAIFVLYLISFPSSAESDWRIICQVNSELAEVIMKNRQQGMSMAKVMEIADMSSQDKMLSAFVESYIIKAYDSPRYSTGEMQIRAIENFRDERYLECVKIFAVIKDAKSNLN